VKEQARAVQMGIYEEEVKKARERIKNGGAKEGSSNGKMEGSVTVTPPSGDPAEEGKASEEDANRVRDTAGTQVRRAVWLSEHAPPCYNRRS
jgi:hypothetical protein